MVLLSLPAPFIRGGSPIADRGGLSGLGGRRAKGILTNGRKECWLILLTRAFLHQQRHRGLRRRPGLHVLGAADRRGAVPAVQPGAAEAEPRAPVRTAEGVRRLRMSAEGGLQIRQAQYGSPSFPSPFSAFPLSFPPVASQSHYATRWNNKDGGGSKQERDMRINVGRETETDWLTDVCPV